MTTTGKSQTHSTNRNSDSHISELEQERRTYSTDSVRTQRQEQQHTIHGLEEHGQTIPLYKIAPRWHSVLALVPKTSQIRFKVDNFYIDISKCDRCIVGEAHNWDSIYDNCDDCYRMSLEFASILRDNPVIRKPQLDKFVEHFNSKHL